MLVLVEDDEEDAEPAARDRPILVWPENWEAVQLYLFLQTQWRTTGMDGARVGLDYRAVHAELEGRGMLDHEPMMVKIQVMEYAALEVYAEQARQRLAKMKRDAAKRSRR